MGGKDRERAVLAWARSRQPQLESALMRWGIRREAAREVAEEVMVAAFLAVGQGREIRQEAPWMAGTVANVLHRSRSVRLSSALAKERARVRELHPVYSSPAARAEVRDTADRVLTHLSHLPPPTGYALVLRWAFSMTQREISSELSRFRPVRPGRVATILRDGERMFLDLRSGRDPASIWPQRYLPRKNPWIGIHLPPLRTLIFKDERIGRPALVGGDP